MNRPVFGERTALMLSPNNSEAAGTQNSEHKHHKRTATGVADGADQLTTAQLTPGEIAVWENLLEPEQKSISDVQKSVVRRTSPLYPIAFKLLLDYLV